MLLSALFTRARSLEATSDGPANDPGRKDHFVVASRAPHELFHERLAKLNAPPADRWCGRRNTSFSVPAASTLPLTPESVLHAECSELAAIDLTFLGARFAILEFAVGVFGSLALGLFVAARSTTTPGRVVAGYILTLGINYVALLLHAVALRHGRDAHGEAADEPGLDPRRATRKYRRGSLPLLVPLAVPILAVLQQRQRRSAV